MSGNRICLWTFAEWVSGWKITSYRYQKVRQWKCRINECTPRDGMDVLKCFAAVLIVRGLYHGSNCLALLMMYAGAGVTLGHNFPFYMKFKGGKGIAVMAALAVSNCFWHLPYSSILFFVTLAFFLVPVLVTRYVSLGSLLAYAVFFIQMVIFGQLGWFDMAKGAVYELYVITFLLTALAWYRHRANIKRLLNGTENKFGSKK